MKVTVTVKHTERATFDIGKMPVNLIRELLIEKDGTFNGNWSLADVDGTETWTVDSIEVEESK